MKGNEKKKDEKNSKLSGPFCKELQVEWQRLLWQRLGL